MALRATVFCLPALVLFCINPAQAQRSSNLLFNRRSEGGLLLQRVYANGDHCLVRQYAGEEHVGLRIVYTLSERQADEALILTLVHALAKEHAGKAEAAAISEAVQKFSGKRNPSPERWVIQVPMPGYAEFFVRVDWLGESVVIQVKYWK